MANHSRAVLYSQVTGEVAGDSESMVKLVEAALARNRAELRLMYLLKIPTLDTETSLDREKAGVPQQKGGKDGRR